MPGLPLNKVRYMDETSGDVYEFPRLYLDDGSWIWRVAVDILKEEFAKNAQSE